MPTWTEGDVSANGIRLHYYRTGGDKPPVVLVHGITDNGLCWTRLARALEQDYDLIMVDARGHGRSSAPAAGYDNADHAADVAGLIQTLRLHQPVLIGHSMGAIISATLAANHPELVRAVGLEDPPWRLDPEVQPTAERLAFAEQWRADVVARQQLTLAQIIARGREQSPTWADEEFEPWAQAKLQVSPQAIDFVRGENLRWSDYIARLKAPTLLVTGDIERGAIVSPQTAKAVAEMNPNIRVVLIADAGHSIRREQFAPYLEAVRHFLHEVYA